MNRSWGTVGVLLCATIVMGVGLIGCGVAATDGLAGEQPLTVVPQASAEGDAIEENGERLDPASMGARNGEAGGPGSMHGRRHGAGAEGGPMGALELTDEQREQAQDIREQTHEDVKALRDAAREEINALLTEEQLAQLEERRADRPELGDERPLGERRHGGHGRGMHRSGESLGDRHQPFESLDLTEEQQSAIDVIRDDVREDIRALHETARDAFRAILTPEQIEILDQRRPPADDQIDQPDAEVED